MYASEIEWYENQHLILVYSYRGSHFEKQKRLGSISHGQLWQFAVPVSLRSNSFVPVIGDKIIRQTKTPTIWFSASKTNPTCLLRRAKGLHGLIVLFIRKHKTSEKYSSSGESRNVHFSECVVHTYKASAKGASRQRAVKPANLITPKNSISKYVYFFWISGLTVRTHVRGYMQATPMFVI